MHGHLLSASKIIIVAIALIDELINAKTAPDQDTRLPILAVDDVAHLQGSGTANMGCLLTKVGHIEGDAALSLRFVQYFIHCRQQEHVTEHFLNDLLTKMWILLFIEYVAIAIQYPVDGYG